MSSIPNSCWNLLEFESIEDQRVHSGDGEFKIFFDHGEIYDTTKLCSIYHEQLVRSTSLACREGLDSSVEWLSRID